MTNEVIPAGSFGQWLRAMRAVLRDEQDADVPCGDCVGCCVSSYPIPLRPRDAVARAQVPEQYLLPAPGRDPDHLLMGFREDGSCPFLAHRSCSIYADRPQTCRDYDCRIYAATGTIVAGDRPVIAARAQAWRFTYAGREDQIAQAALRQAALFIQTWRGRFPVAMRAGQPTATAVMAIKTYEVFLAQPDDHCDPAVAALVSRVVDAARAFDIRPAGANS
jgi:uncharacterized protein